MNIKHLIFTILSCLALSCMEQENEEVNLTGINEPLRLDLVATAGQLANSYLSGEEMPWQEYFLLQEDMRFEKVRLSEGEESRSSGVFAIERIDGDKYLKFTHETKNNTYGNCTGSRVELLRYSTSNELRGSWDACDGPSLFYAFQ